jgi:hypothetical protein
MAELIIEDTTSLYDPITVSLEGKVYLVRQMDRKALRDLDAWDKKLRDSPDVVYQRLEFIFDVKPGAFDHLEPRLVAEMSGFVIKELYKATRKKVMEPGNKGLKK